MWEAKAAEGRANGLVDFALAHADPAAEVYRSVDDRVVVIDPSGHGMPAVPGALVAREPHVWGFERLPR